MNTNMIGGADFILGAGFTGLAAAFASRLPVFEAEARPGGVCSSYYVRPDSVQKLDVASDDEESYRFELGGGRWIFGADSILGSFIDSLTPTKTYARRSSVFFPQERLHVPYPLQNHLSYLPQEVRIRALTEMMAGSRESSRTMAESLREIFGTTLTQMFFGPFHELYTAGLWTEIAPQDIYKTPVDVATTIRGAYEGTAPVGYNATFLYPEQGLNALALGLASRCDVSLGKRVVDIDLCRRRVSFEDGSSAAYRSLISTLPLNKMLGLAHLSMTEKSDPFTSLLVINIGAIRGSRCPNDHWIYVPASVAGFHRVGFYSNVDSSFLPRTSRSKNDRVSIYVERAYRVAQKPTDDTIDDYVEAVVQELQDWGFIERAEVVDPSWIEIAYTWSFPGSSWRASALQKLEANGIVMLGRYGRWSFQGIAQSIREGLYAGSVARVRDCDVPQLRLRPGAMRDQVAHLIQHL